MHIIPKALRRQQNQFAKMMLSSFKFHLTERTHSFPSRNWFFPTLKCCFCVWLLPSIIVERIFCLFAEAWMSRAKNQEMLDHYAEHNKYFIIFFDEHFAELKNQVWMVCMKFILCGIMSHSASIDFYDFWPFAMTVDCKLSKCAFDFTHYSFFIQNRRNIN